MKLVKQEIPCIDFSWVLTAGIIPHIDPWTGILANLGAWYEFRVKMYVLKRALWGDVF